jgi:DNA repair protein RadC
MTYDIISVRKRKTIQIKHPDDIYAAVKRYTKSDQEHFLVLTLDGAHNIISIHISTFGLVNRTIVHPREVFKHAIKDNASSIIVCHNHPSGSLLPSPHDNEVTDRLTEAGDILGFHVLDHLIISKNGYYSFRKEGKMNNESDFSIKE